MRLLIFILALITTPAFAQDVRISPPSYIADTAWTPADASGAGLAFTGVTARYTKIGNMVNATFRVTYPSTVSGANAAISGLPVPASSNFTAATNVAAGSCFSNVATNANFVVRIQAGATQIDFVNNTGAAPANSALSTLVVSCAITYISN